MKFDINVPFFFAVWFSFCSICYTQSTQNAKDLRTKLFTNNSYDFRVRPVANHIDTLNISVDFYLLSINAIDEVEETLKTTGYLVLTWTDLELTWKPESYGELTYIFVPQNEIWKPDIALKNSYSEYKPLGVSQLNVKVMYDGTIEWYPFQVFVSTCPVDIRYYPFDVQTCQLNFAAWSYGKSEVYLRSRDGVALYEYEENPSWALTDTTVSEEVTKEESAIMFQIRLKRKYLYAMISVVFPMIVLTILDIFVFVLPCESGEKSGYAVTVFLTFAVFLTIIESTRPENSTSVPLFSIYVVLMTTQSTVITMIALAMVRCTTFDENITPVPKWMIFLAQVGRFQICRNRKSTNKIKQSEYEDEESKHDEAAAESDVPEMTHTWKDVINGLDALCFMLFTVFSILITAVCIGCSAALASMMNTAFE